MHAYLQGRYLQEVWWEGTKNFPDYMLQACCHGHNVAAARGDVIQ